MPKQLADLSSRSLQTPWPPCLTQAVHSLALSNNTYGRESLLSCMCETVLAPKPLQDLSVADPHEAVATCHADRPAPSSSRPQHQPT